jgi:phosphatidylglycerol---prolipoprotein diacylglyceryl transferase
MFPILFELGGIKVYSYGFFIALGYLAGLFLGRFLVRERGLPAAPYMDLGLVAIVSGVLGGRVLFVLTNLAYFKQHPWETLDFWQGGLVFSGGFFSGVAASVLYLRWKKLPLGTSLDIMAPSVALAHAFGRIGCLGAGCCYGSYCPYPWGVHLHSAFVETALQGKPLHPTQVYEAASLFLLSAGLVHLFRRKKLPEGGVGIAYVAAYAVLRSVIEIFRGDEVRGFVVGRWLSTSQAIALVLLLACGGFLIGRFRRKHL